jgi:hypothetical protein
MMGTKMISKKLFYVAVALCIIIGALAVLGVAYQFMGKSSVVVSGQLVYPPNSIYFTPGGQAQVIQSGASLTAQSGSTVDLEGTNTIADPVISGFVIHSTASYTPTDGVTMTLGAEFITLTPGDVVTATTLPAGTSGQFVILYNANNFNVTITDAGNFIGAGDQTLGQYDALVLVCIGTKWVQVAAVSAN